VEQASRENTAGQNDGSNSPGSEMAGVEGIERDKRGELIVLLPHSDRVVLRQRGFVAAPQAEGEKEGDRPLIEKGSQFSGVLSDEEGVIPFGEAPAEKLPKEAPIPEELQETVITLDRPEAKPEPVAQPAAPAVPSPAAARPTDDFDFDLDFGLPGRKESGPGLAPPAAPRRGVEERPRPGRVKKAPAWKPPEETTPVAPPSPAPQTPKPQMSVPLDELETEKSLPPMIIEGPRPEAEPESRPGAALQPEAPLMEAHSYLDGSSVIEKPKPREYTRKHRKMVLPKAIREKARTSPILLAIFFLLFAVLACILSVQHVPQVRRIYDYLVVDMLGLAQAPEQSPGAERQVDQLPTIIIGPEKVELPQGTGLAPVEAYTRVVRRTLSEAYQTAFGEERDEEEDKEENEEEKE